MTNQQIPYSIHATTASATITFFDPQGSGSKVIASSHPMFTKVRDALLSEGEYRYADLAKMADTAAYVRAELTRLSDHLTFDGDALCWDGDMIDTALSRHLVRMLKAGNENYRGLVAFMERVAANPSQRSRIHLWSWLNAADFTITPDGLILGYKGVQNTDDNLSVFRGSEPVAVNGVVHTGYIPNPAGALVSMPRSLVATDRDEACSVGLHVGTWAYANGFGKKVLRVLVDPANVVSVPKDCNAQKMRVCAYTVLDAEPARCVEPVWGSAQDDDYYYEDDDLDDDLW